VVGRELLTLCPTGEDHQGAHRVWGDIMRAWKTCIDFNKLGVRMRAMAFC
jgi:hypothetical protein